MITYLTVQCTYTKLNIRQLDATFPRDGYFTENIKKKRKKE